MLSECLLTDRVAIVTGAGQGIGAATAALLARAGATVLIGELDAEQAESVAGSIRAAGYKCEAHGVDVTSPNRVRELAAYALARHGRIDVLVNNAGYYGKVPTLEMDDASMDRMMAVNYKGVQHCCQAALPAMIARGCGSIVNVASMAGIKGSSSQASHYAASKGAVIALTRSRAAEFGPRGVRINAVAPGQGDTQLFRASIKERPERLPGIVEAIPLRRLGQPEDIARAILFLASDLAGFVTGQVLSVCGGRLLA